MGFGNFWRGWSFIGWGEEGANWFWGRGREEKGILCTESEGGSCNKVIKRWLVQKLKVYINDRTNGWTSYGRELVSPREGQSDLSPCNESHLIYPAAPVFPSVGLTQGLCVSEGQNLTNAM